MKLQSLTMHLISLCMFFASCNRSNNNIVDKNLHNQKIIKELDPVSKFQISIWQDYTIEENNGPDFVVYYLHPIDTAIKFPGNAGIYFGGYPQRIRPDGEKKLVKDSLIAGNLLGKKVAWTIFDYGNNISAETILELNNSNKISAFAYASNYPGIDSLINMLQSLKHKE